MKELYDELAGLTQALENRYKFDLNNGIIRTQIFHKYKDMDPEVYLCYRIYHFGEEFNEKLLFSCLFTYPLLVKDLYYDWEKIKNAT